MIENNKLVTIITPMYQDASTTTLDEFTNQAIFNFSHRILLCYHASTKVKEIKIENNDKDKFNLEIDETKFSSEQDKVRFISAVTNIKQRLYSNKFYDSWLYDVKNLRINEFVESVYKFQVNVKNINFLQSITDLKSRIINYFKFYTCGEVQQKPNMMFKNIIDIPNWQDLFGKGEFPCLFIYVFRLGNTEYFAYTIKRD